MAGGTVPDDDDLVPAEMLAGSAVLYLGSTIHAGGANVTTDERRRGMHVSYCAGWLRTEENQFLTVPLDAVRAMPRRSQELLGYAADDGLASGGGYLGTVDLQHPVDLLAEGALVARRPSGGQTRRGRTPWRARARRSRACGPRR